MANIVYNSFKRDVANGSIDLDTDAITVMLLTSAYTPTLSHSKRSNLSNEITGTGYTAGGAALAGLSMTVVGTQGVWTASSVNWPSATFTARYAVLYKARGGASSADELIACFDFGSDQSPTATTFTLNWGTPGIATIG